MGIFNYFFTNIIIPTITNAIAPILLFLIGYIFMHNYYFAKNIHNIYYYVKNKLELDNEEFMAPGFNKDEINIKQNGEREKVINKISKNYGPDKSNGWRLRTFYIFNKKQIMDTNFINFQVRNHKEFNITLETKSLIKNFKLDSNKENISDNADKIRVYIYQDKLNNKYYIVRFGKKELSKPIPLNKNKKVYKLG